VSTIFTAGVRTTGRVETENRVNKAIGGPKKSLFQLYCGLNDRTKDQTEHEQIDQRQTLFLRIINILRKFVGPYANAKCRREMEESMYYTAEVVQLPSGSRDWHMINTFENDHAYISARWLMNLIRLRGLHVKHLIRVVHRATKAAHYVVLLRDGRYLCDCCMDTNLGLVCRHFFVLWVTIQDLPFHLSLIRPRCVTSSGFYLILIQLTAGT
ncbi:hypothetical protein DFH07DRAFT_726502, partial [Mycena maculata]